MTIILTVACIVLLLLAALPVAVSVCARRKFDVVGSDCAIVLGALVHPDGRPCTTLRRRCDCAVQAYRAGLVPMIIVCGGRGHNEPAAEAEVMADYLVVNGVPRECLLCEDTSTNTEENLINAGYIMREFGYSTALLITTDYHMTRTLWIARDLNMHLNGMSSKGPDRIGHVLRSRLRESASWIRYAWRKLSTM